VSAIVRPLRGAAVEPGVMIKSGGRWYTVRSLAAMPGHPGARVAEVTDTRGRPGHVVIDGAEDYPSRRAPRPSPGRPEIGSVLGVRVSAALRAAVLAAARPGESHAETARRLLAVAVAPVLADALALAAAAYDDASSALCETCAELPGGELCAAHVEAVNRADACRALAAELVPIEARL